MPGEEVIKELDMTREEAIKELEEMQGRYCFNESELDALDMTIEVLKQEPYGDAISRQAAMDCLTEIGLTKFDLIARNKIKNLPPVTPQEPCEEAISREQAKSDYADWFGYGYEDNTYYKHLCSMSSATSQPKTRHWNRVTDKTGHLIWECDCGWQQRFNTNFCPDCGAKMEEVEE